MNYQSKTLLSLFRDLLFFLFDTLCLVGTQENNRSLVVVRVDNIGDFVLWCNFGKKLCDYYSESRPLILVCNETCVDLAWSLNFFDHIIGVNVQKFNYDLIYRYKRLREISSLGADLAIQPTYSRVFLSGDSLIRASGARERIGSVGDLNKDRPWQKVISDRWYTHLVPVSPQPLMELERNAEFLRGLGIQQAAAEVPSIPKLIDLPFNKRLVNDYFVLFPGASSAVREWPLESFAAVARYVRDKLGWDLVVCGGPSEERLNKQLLRLIGDMHSIDLTGTSTLPELAEVLRGAQLVVSNETSAIHIAAGVGVPSVCILGGGHYGRFMPYPAQLKGVKPVPVSHPMDCFGCNWRCKWTDEKSGPYPCVREVGVEQVIAGIDTAIADFSSL